jgi:hypothetical protein
MQPYLRAVEAGNGLGKFAGAQAGAPLAAGRSWPHGPPWASRARRPGHAATRSPARRSARGLGPRCGERSSQATQQIRAAEYSRRQRGELKIGRPGLFLVFPEVLAMFCRKARRSRRGKSMSAIVVCRRRPRAPRTRPAVSTPLPGRGVMRTQTFADRSREVAVRLFTGATSARRPCSIRGRRLADYSRAVAARPHRVRLYRRREVAVRLAERG